MSCYRFDINLRTFAFSLIATSIFSGCSLGDETYNNEVLSSDCQTCLTEIIIHSNFPFPVNKSQVKVRIDEESVDFVKMKLYDDSNGNPTLGWVIYRPKERKLANVSGYLDSLPLAVHQKWLDKYEACKGISAKKTQKEQIALNQLD